MQEMKIKLGEKSDNVRMILADGSSYPVEGKVEFCRPADRSVNRSTDT